MPPTILSVLPASTLKPLLPEVKLRPPRLSVRFFFISCTEERERFFFNVTVPPSATEASAEASEAKVFVSTSATGSLPAVTSSSLPWVEATTTLLRAYSTSPAVTVNVRATLEEGSQRQATGWPSAWRILSEETAVPSPSLKVNAVVPSGSVRKVRQTVLPSRLTCALFMITDPSA